MGKEQESPPTSPPSSLAPIEIFPGQPSQQDQIPAFRKSAKMRKVEGTHGAAGESITDILRRLYQEEGKTQEEAGEALGVSRTMVQSWMVKTGVEVRSKGWRKGRPRGEAIIDPKAREAKPVVENLDTFLTAQGRARIMRPGGLRALCEEGLSDEEIAKRLKVAVSTVTAFREVLRLEKNEFGG